MADGGIHGEVDLFGDPVRLPNGRRGRPAHVPSEKNHNKVMMLCALGWSKERIANALHIAVPTLTKYYSSTLKRRAIQRDRLDAWRFEKAMEQVEAGNVGAMNHLDKLIQQNDRMISAARLRQEERDNPPLESVGKKEAARRAAAEKVEGQSSFGDDLTPGKYAN